MTTTMTDLQTGRTHVFNEALPGRDAYEEALALGFVGSRAADGALRAARREALEVSASGAFQPGLFAGGLLRLPGLRPEFDGDWTLTQVRHSLDASGLSTDFSAKREFDR